jgi:hypothetical protein
MGVTNRAATPSLSSLKECAGYNWCDWKCPAGGEYSIGNLSTYPACSIKGHSVEAIELLERECVTQSILAMLASLVIAVVGLGVIKPIRKRKFLYICLTLVVAYIISGVAVLMVWEQCTYVWTIKRQFLAFFSPVYRLLDVLDCIYDYIIEWT